MGKVGQRGGGGGVKSQTAEEGNIVVWQRGGGDNIAIWRLSKVVVGEAV